MKRSKKMPSKKAAVKKPVKKSAKKAVVKKTAGSTKKAVSPAKPAKKKLVKKVASPKKANAKKLPLKSTAKKQVKKKKEDLMCFLTTACVHQYGLADNCYELETLRAYRDTYLQQNDAGKILVKAYYAVAPKIVQKISKHPKKEKYYTYIYQRVQRSCCAIENKQFEQAKRIYQNMVLYLQKQVLVGS